ncbi:DUF1127 domain-containing protein [Curvivirga sp.]|uniref:DUF1127 domain-containing protein n=1 Tax=Curvivirga sp. TaxID=2856848 RepID=UPI003B5A62D0
MATNTQFVDTLGGTSGLLVDTMADIMSGFGSAVASVVAAARTWQARVEERKHLASLDARLLDDMGMTRADALREGNKPFWMS